MDDEDSGIYQSRADSASVDDSELVKRDNETFSSSSTIEGSDSFIFENNSAELNGGESELDEVSSMSEDDCSSDTSDSFDEDHKNEFQPPSRAEPFIPKKKLSVGDSFPQCQAGRNTGNTTGLQELLPGMKITYREGERGERWEFSDSSHTQEKSAIPVKTNLKKSSDKKMLKLELSTSVTADLSDTTPTPEEHFTNDGRDYPSPNSDASTDLNESLSDESPAAVISLELRDPDKSQCSEWKRLFNECECVTVHCGDFFLSKFHHDALIVPGNSFGYLDGEPEIQYTEKFGWQLQRRVQKQIVDMHDGELLVGQAIIVRLGKDEYGNDTGVRFAIYVPVMRVPLQVEHSVNAYLAFRAALRAVKLHNEESIKEDRICNILCPSLCNGFGNMPAGRTALQMKEAYKAVMDPSQISNVLSPNGLGALATRHVKMTTKTGNCC